MKRPPSAQKILDLGHKFSTLGAQRKHWWTTVNSGPLAGTVGDAPLAERLALPVTLALARVLRACENLPDGSGKSRAREGVSRELARLRRSNQASQRLRIAADVHAATQKRQHQEAMAALVPQIMDFLYHDEQLLEAEGSLGLANLLSHRDKYRQDGQPMPQDLKDLLVQAPKLVLDAATQLRKARANCWDMIHHWQAYDSSVRQEYDALDESARWVHPEKEYLSLSDSERFFSVLKSCLKKKNSPGSSEANQGESSQIKPNQGGKNAGDRSQARRSE